MTTLPKSCSHQLNMDKFVTVTPICTSASKRKASELPNNPKKAKTTNSINRGGISTQNRFTSLQNDPAHGAASLPTVPS